MVAITFLDGWIGDLRFNVQSKLSGCLVKKANFFQLPYLCRNINTNREELTPVRCMDISPGFSIIFTKDNKFYDFLFAFLGNAALSKIGSTLMGNNLLIRKVANSFVYELNP